MTEYIYQSAISGHNTAAACLLFKLFFMQSELDLFCPILYIYCVIV